ncbi:iron ABC transporter permease [Laspinema olomoucense]|uniref:iron ABC transporter permease n=1 Tax=Laspinema olomoucense TaxID=3231600 RepID=UPI0021BB2E0F|nr:iron ABC transporter permease [Laspinema sp. D3c]MCT7996747.1 iron ABC transporter permease [Laspinema sp. D3c]
MVFKIFGSKLSPIASRQLTFAVLILLGGLLLLVMLLFIHIIQGQTDINMGTTFNAIIAPNDDIPAHNIVRLMRLPRAAIAVITGAAWGIAGALLQTVTRNPLASSSTLGINAGAYFAVAATGIFAPDLFARSPVLVALTGGLLAAGLTYAIAAGVEVSPIRLTLSGVAVSLALASFTALLQVFYENQTTGLFFWGAGSLLQTDWTNSAYAFPRVAIAAGLALLMSHSLDVLLLGDDMARSLGQRVQLTRLSGTAIAVFLAAVAVSVVGPIGFIGLVAPHLVRLMGCRPHALLLPGSAIWGAVVLVAADIFAQSVKTNLSEIPVGTVIPLVGAPFLIGLVRKTANLDGGKGRTALTSSHISSRRFSYPLLLGTAIVALVVALVAGLVWGGITLNLSEILATFLGGGTALSQKVIFNLRLPRLLVAIFAGASLSVSGLLLQGVVRNAIAGPEIVGITSGAGLGAMCVLILLPNPPVEAVAIAAFVGAFVAFAAVCLLAWRDGLSPASLALVGIAVSAFCSSGINLLVVMAKLRVAQALVWLSGSTYAREWVDLWRLIAWPLVLLPIAWIFSRWLDLMALGDDVPRLVGIPLQKARGILLAIAVALAAAAVSTVGTISFVGLIAPHAARILVGTNHRKLVPFAAILGALLVAISDTLGRVVLAPKEIPAGLVVAAIGTPYFLWLLWQTRGKMA